MSLERSEVLLRISDTIAGTRDLQELLRLLAPTLKHAVDFDYVAIFLHDPEKNLMNLHLIERFFDGPTPTSSIPPDQSPAGRCFLTQQHLIIDDVDSEQRFAPDVIAILQKYNVKSSCYQPLTTRPSGNSEPFHLQVLKLETFQKRRCLSCAALRIKSPSHWITPAISMSRSGISRSWKRNATACGFCWK